MAGQAARRTAARSMANESTAPAPVPADPTAAPSWRALPPGEQARLAKCYRAGLLATATPDYAIDLFATCVLGDPGNPVFLGQFLLALKRKFGAKKPGGLSSLFGGGWGGMRRLAANAQWREIIKQGVDRIKANPHDHDCLLAMAEACGNLMAPEAQRLYLKAALEAAPKDPDVNRQCAAFLASHGEYDQAIACWVRIRDLKGLGEEAERAITDLQVSKTRSLLGQQTEKSAAAADANGGGDGGADRIARLERTIRDNPTDIESHLELADLLERDRTIEEAEKVLARALAASGNELKVREHVEDRQLRWARAKVMIAEKRVEADDTPENRATVERLKVSQLRQEIDIYAARCSRYPENITWKYELALRLKAAGKHAEAIRSFQDALQDTRRKGVISLELGECFQSIKQYQLAMQNYEAAIESLAERDVELRKRALYRAGVLAAGLKDLDNARKHLSAVAGLDFGYRDVAQRLDKLRSGTDNPPSGS